MPVTTPPDAGAPEVRGLAALRALSVLVLLALAVMGAAYARASDDPAAPAIFLVAGGLALGVALWRPREA